MMTMSLRMSVGARHCSTYARNVSPVIAPSSTKGAVIPLWRRAATKVMVFQCPCGTRPTSRSPRGQRPLSRTIFVLAAVSSMNTNRVESSMPCSRIQRRRAQATSARSCSAARRLFFERDLVSSEKPPERGAAAGDPPLAHRDKHLVERQIRLFRDQGEQPIRPLLQWRSASSVWYGHSASGIAPALKPFDRRTGADLKIFGSLAPRSTALNSCDDALSKFHRIRVWHCSTSKGGINANRLAHKQPLGNPSILLGTFRFYSAETCSSRCIPHHQIPGAVWYRVSDDRRRQRRQRHRAKQRARMFAALDKHGPRVLSCRSDRGRS